MYFKLFGSIIVGIGTSIFLYYDINNRRKFYDEFIKTKTINNKKLITGKLHSQNPISFVNDNNQYVITKSITYIGKIFEHIQFDFNNKYRSTHKVNHFYWDKTHTNILFSPIINLNDNTLVFKEFSKIYFPIKRTLYKNGQKVINMSLINNTNVSILAENDNDNLIVECLGSNTDVEYYVAEKYYGISDMNTLIVGVINLAFLLSFILSN